MDLIELPHTHVITPGDHFSPRTGSAVPTVVDGLSRAAPLSAPRSAVVVARGTYAERYDSAEVVEYEPSSRHVPAQRYFDAIAGRLGQRRPVAGHSWRAAVAGQRDWPSSFVFAHNGPQLVREIDESRHEPVLYAHNELFRSYSKREAGRVLATVVRIICVSDDLADRTASSLPAYLAERVRVVPNGVDCNTFRPEPGGAAKVSSTAALRVLYLGRIIRDKGPDVLIEAGGLLGRSDFELVIVGSQGFDPSAALGDYEMSLRRLASDRRVLVRFVPSVPRRSVPELLRASDVLVVPSCCPETFSLTLTEGLASGIAVVASAVGGIPQALGGAGVLVPPDDPRALSEVLASLADDPDLRARLGEQARSYAIAHDWTWSRARLDQVLQDDTNPHLSEWA